MKDSVIANFKIVGIAKNDASTCRGALNAIDPKQNFVHECMNNIKMHTPDSALTADKLKGKKFL